MVVQAYLDRIEVYEDRINAITVVNPAALDRADELDAALAAGDEPGQLFCVPMLVKDNFDTHDLVTTGGSIALAESLPPDDAFMVRRIREEGAIVVAKTNMAEWAFSARQSVSSSFDTTRNAYALDRVPAGSSGGTASGVGERPHRAGQRHGQLGRRRAWRWSVSATIGLTSFPLSFDRDIGAAGQDVARLQCGGYDADPYTEAGRGRKEGDYTDFLDANGLQGADRGAWSRRTPTPPWWRCSIGLAELGAETEPSTILRHFTRRAPFVPLSPPPSTADIAEFRRWAARSRGCCLRAWTFNVVSVGTTFASSAGPKPPGYTEAGRGRKEDRLARHGRSPIRMEGEHAGLDTGFRTLRRPASPAAPSTL